MMIVTIINSLCVGRWVLSAEVYLLQFVVYLSYNKLYCKSATNQIKTLPQTHNR